MPSNTIKKLPSIPSLPKEKKNKLFDPNGAYLRKKRCDYVVIPAEPESRVEKYRPTIGRFWMPASAGMTAVLHLEALSKCHSGQGDLQ